MSDSEVGMEKRVEERIEERDKVTVTVLSSPEAPEIERKNFHCWTRDLSGSGLKFTVHTHVPIGAVLKLEVTFVEDPCETFRHIGKVMWAREFDDNGVISSWLGVKFAETLGGDKRLQDWERIINERIEP
jgi:hypothetical protein